MSVTVTAPAVGSGEHGPSSGSDAATTYFDQYGQPVWTKDADGHITYMQYDLGTGVGTGVVVKTITDVNTNDTGDFSGSPVPVPTGWSNTSGLELVTTTQVDGLGRPTQVVTDADNPTNPDSRTTYIVYNDANHETRTYAVWNSTTHMTTGPIQVSREYRGGSVLSGTATVLGTQTTLTDTTNLSASGAYIGLTISVTSGTDSGQVATVTAYDSVNKKLTFSPPFSSNTATSTQYVLSTPVYDETLTSRATPTLNGSVPDARK